MNQNEINIYRKNSHGIYRSVIFQELLSDELINRWSRIDILTKFLVLITASGSAFAGWYLWSTNEGKFVWATIAVIVSLVSGANTVMKVPDRIREQEGLRHMLLDLQSDIESFRRRLKILDDHKDIPNRYDDIEKKWKACRAQFKSQDILFSRELENTVKSKRDQFINEKRYNK